MADPKNKEKHYTKSTDVFSLGIIFYKIFIVVDRHPYNSSTNKNASIEENILNNNVDLQAIKDVNSIAYHLVS